MNMYIQYIYVCIYVWTHVQVILKNKEINNDGLRVMTVDSFQGRLCVCICISACVYKYL
jgi:hypothetical protein